MARWRMTENGARKRGERERRAGLDPEDEAARWLAEQEPVELPAAPKAASKSKTLHRWRRAQKP